MAAIESRLLNRRLISGCWLWTGALDDSGYGKIYFGGIVERTHRVAAFLWLEFDIFEQPDFEQDRVCVLHTCRNRNCFNPEHLYLGTKQDNADDRIRDDTNRQGRWQQVLTDEQVRQILYLHKHGLSNREISKHFPVSHTAVNKIVNGETYTHIERGE